MLEDFGPPFADVNADFALQSSDDKLFRVHKLILQKTSGFFSTFPFDTAIPETRTHDDDLPILVLAEPSRVLGHLLRIVYSMRLPSSLFSMMDTHLLLAAAEKYMVEGVGDRVEGWLACSGQLERSPLEAYSLACRHKLLDTARRAARITLSQSFNALVEQSNPELLNLRTGADCTRLERYRSACTLAARVLCSTMAWGRRHSGPLSVSSFWDCQRCNEENTTGRDNTVARASLWWSNYLERERVKRSSGYLPAHPLPILVFSSLQRSKLRNVCTVRGLSRGI